MDRRPHEPQLLLGLTHLALHALLRALRPDDKLRLLRASKEARTAVLHTAPTITFAVMRGMDTKASKELCALLAACAHVDEPLHLVLDARKADDAAISAVLQQLGAQQQPCRPGKNILEIWLPMVRGSESYSLMKLQCLQAA